MTTEIKEILKRIDSDIKFRQRVREIYQNATPELKKIASAE